MKVLELYENKRISTAKEFKDSFTSDEWASILCQVVSISTQTSGFSGGLVKDDPSAATEFKSRLERDIGPQIPDHYTTSAWNGRAVRYGIRVPTDSWQSYHNHLKQYVGKPCNVEFGPAPSNNGAERNIQQANDTTPETLNDIIAAAPNLPDPIVDIDQALDFLRLAYALINQAPQRTEVDAGGNTFHQWVNSRSKNVPQPQPGEEDQGQIIKNRFLEIVPESGYPITKIALATRFLAWLRMADRYIATARRRHEND